jgi:adenine-specific DNA-methyltransferase
MLRDNVEEIMTPRLIAKLGNYVFQNAFTDACFYVGQKNKQINNTKIVWTHNIANAAAEALRSSRKLRFSKSTVFSEENYSVYYSDVPHEDWMPHSLKGIKLKQNLERRLDSMQLKTIKQIFDVKQGARIGSSVFVIDGEFFNQLSSREKRFFRPVSQNKNILNGKLSVINYLFYPNSEGLETINNEDSLKVILPFFYNFKLLPNKALLQNRARRTENNWWLLSEDRAWQRKKEPKLISTEFGKAGSFAFDKTGEFAVERGCAWIPKNEEKFSEHTYYAYLSIFCSDFFNDLLGIYSTQIAGGNWWHLSKNDTDEIPIPDLTQANQFQSEKFILLNGIGRKLSEGIEKIDTSLLNSLVRDIYEQY